MVVKSVQPVPLYKKQLSESPPTAPTTKKKKLEQGSSYRVEEYSPSKSPIYIDNEYSLMEQLKQMGGEKEIFITTTDTEEGVPKEPPVPTLALTVGDYQGKEIDPMVE